jgi:predicted RNA-binding protein with RPS1 domain
VILKIDSENQRLSLGMKQLQPNVLEEFFQTHSTGMVLTGKIVRLTDFGAFVELFDGVEGLVHVSELSNERIEKPEDAVAMDQNVRVKVIKVDPVEKKIGLSIKAALNEPDTEAVQAYFDNRGGDGSATLGDLMDPKIFAPPGAAVAEVPETDVERAAEPEAGETESPAPVAEETETPVPEAAAEPTAEVSEALPAEEEAETAESDAPSATDEPASKDEAESDSNEEEEKTT